VSYIYELREYKGKITNCVLASMRLVFSVFLEDVACILNFERRRTYGPCDNILRLADQSPNSSAHTPTIVAGDTGHLANCNWVILQVEVCWSGPFF
jgi:hypothetical protein